MHLRLTNLACSRAGRRLFAGIHLDLAPGGIAHVRGPNGSGKSSLLLVVAGLLPAEAGSVHADGEPLRPESVAFAGHRDGLKPALTLAENLHAWAGILGAGAGAVPGALAALHLTHRADTPAGQCSAGECRRAALARVWLTGRPLWLLDEPGATLDADGRRLLGRLLAGHRQAGGTALIATHDRLPPAPAAVIELAAPSPDSAEGWPGGAEG